MSFCDKYLEGVITGQGFPLCDRYILIRDHILYTGVVLNNGILHQDTVLNFCTFADVNATE